jgi:hypothetical protein
VASNQADRAVVKVAEYYFSQGDIKRAALTMKTLLKSTDDRCRQKAAQFMFDHNWRKFEHENPAIQKVEHSGSISIAQQIIEAHAKRKAG